MSGLVWPWGFPEGPGVVSVPFPRASLFLPFISSEGFIWLGSGGCAGIGGSPLPNTSCPLRLSCPLLFLIQTGGFLWIVSPWQFRLPLVPRSDNLSTLSSLVSSKREVCIVIGRTGHAGSGDGFSIVSYCSMSGMWGCGGYREANYWCGVLVAETK